MRLFTKETVPGVESGLAPLSQERIKAALKRAGWSYCVDADGDIGVTWVYGSFHFLINGDSGELLCVRGFWHGKVEESEYLRALKVCNAWNFEKLWPKAYVERDDEGVLRLHAELSVDYEHGLSDDQLLQHLACAIDTSMTFFERVNKRFPELWERARPQ
ncbi:YbjN domain-containing protein [Rhodococcus sp. ABRD24]|nr:YbjN domain-containing protein [Rhodococcus sp. ABRD24]